MCIYVYTQKSIYVFMHTKESSCDIHTYLHTYIQYIHRVWCVYMFIRKWVSMSLCIPKRPRVIFSSEHNLLKCWSVCVCACLYECCRIYGNTMLLRKTVIGSWTHVYIYIYIYIYIYMHKHIYIYIYMHKHIYTHTLRCNRS